DLHHLGYRGQFEFIARRAQELQAFDAHALKRVGRGARFVGAAAQHARTGARNAFCRLEELRLALDRARAGHDDDFAAADLDAAGIDDRLLAPECPAGEFVRLTDPHHFLHAVVELELAGIDRLDVSYYA